MGAYRKYLFWNHLKCLQLFYQFFEVGIKKNEQEPNQRLKKNCHIIYCAKIPNDKRRIGESTVVVQHPFTIAPNFRSIQDNKDDWFFDFVEEIIDEALQSKKIVCLTLIFDLD